VKSHASVEEIDAAEPDVGGTLAGARDLGGDVWIELLADSGSNEGDPSAHAATMNATDASNPVRTTCSMSVTRLAASCAGRP
jgi:hypothetical protein